MKSRHVNRLWIATLGTTLGLGIAGLGIASQSFPRPIAYGPKQCAGVFEPGVFTPPNCGSNCTASSCSHTFLGNNVYQCCWENLTHCYQSTVMHKCCATGWACHVVSTTSYPGSNCDAGGCY